MKVNYVIEAHAILSGTLIVPDGLWNSKRTNDSVSDYILLNYLNDEDNVHRTITYTEEKLITAVPFLKNVTGHAAQERKRILDFVKRRIDERRKWAESEDGKKTLGPGHPTIPGMEDLEVIRHFIEYNSDYFTDKR